MFTKVMRMLIGAIHGSFGTEPRYFRKPTFESRFLRVPVVLLAPNGAFDAVCFDYACSMPIAFIESLVSRVLSLAIKIQGPDGVSHRNAAGTCRMFFQHAFARHAADDGDKRIVFS